MLLRKPTQPSTTIMAGLWFPRARWGGYTAEQLGKPILVGLPSCSAVYLESCPIVFQFFMIGRREGPQDKSRKLHDCAQTPRAEIGLELLFCNESLRRYAIVTPLPAGATPANDADRHSLRPRCPAGFSAVVYFVWWVLLRCHPNQPAY